MKKRALLKRLRKTEKSLKRRFRDPCGRSDCFDCIIAGALCGLRKEIVERSVKAALEAARRRGKP
jgi:hypothetical protein